MQAISDFVAKQTSFNNRLATAIDGLAGDVKQLNDKIAEIQNSPGTISPEDQASLDALTKMGDELAAKAEALDALTPPTVPPVPPG